MTGRKKSKAGRMGSQGRQEGRRDRKYAGMKNVGQGSNVD